MLPLQTAQFYAQCKAYIRLNEQLQRMIHQFEIANSRTVYYNNYNSQLYAFNQCYLNLQAKSIHHLLPYSFWNPQFAVNFISANTEIAAITERYEPPNTKLYPLDMFEANEEDLEIEGNCIIEEPPDENDRAVEESAQDASVEIISLADSDPASPTAELCNIDLQVLDISDQTLNELLENKESLGDSGVFDELLEGYFSDSSQTLFIDTDYESDKEKGT